MFHFVGWGDKKTGKGFLILILEFSYVQRSHKISYKVIKIAIFYPFLIAFTTPYCTKLCTIQSLDTPLSTGESKDERASFLCCRSHPLTFYLGRENSKCRNRRCSSSHSSMEPRSFFLPFILYPLHDIVVKKALNLKDCLAEGQEWKGRLIRAKSLSIIS